jgi:hypothetical protein
MVYGYKGNLHSNLVTAILEHYFAKVLTVVDCDMPWDAVAADYILPEEFSDCCRSYIFTGLASTHFVKYLADTIAKEQLPCAGVN